MLQKLPQPAAFLIMALIAQMVFAIGTSAESRKIIIDDDAFGPMHYMLLNAPDVEVLGITTVSGNTWANRVTAQSLRGLEISGDTDIPVVEGATFPLLNSERLTERVGLRLDLLDLQITLLERAQQGDIALQGNLSAYELSNKFKTLTTHPAPERTKGARVFRRPSTSTSSELVRESITRFRHHRCGEPVSGPTWTRTRDQTLMRRRL